jgi:hypothetical protein
LRRLKDLELISGDSGSYAISHEIFWKGGTDERAALGKRKIIEKSVVVSFEHEREEKINKFENSN